MGNLKGISIGPYVVSREIGRGGMGVVYLARDSRLDREVAVKTLPTDLAADADRCERFLREARTLARLQHANVAGIHDVEEHEGGTYLILEYVPGETLRQRLDRGRIPVRDALRIATEIAAGVEAAHRAGFVHRDLKPANVKITPAGHAKVLDFGLARTCDAIIPAAPVDPDGETLPADSPTVAGAVLGTPAYMSPEQAKGQAVDLRTDVWAIGVMLYEMLTGESPFLRDSATESIGAVLHLDIDFTRLPPRTPWMARRVLERCLAREAEDRYQDVGDVRADLMFARTRPNFTPGRSPAAARAEAARRRWIGAAIGLGLAGGMLVGGWLVGRGMTPVAPQAIVHAALTPPPGTRIVHSGDLAGPPVVSPDGTAVAFVAVRDGAERRLWIRRLDAPEAEEQSGTEGAMFPFWSPDGASVGFFTVDRLRRLDVEADTVLTVCQVDQARGGAWTPDGRIIFSPSFRGGLSVVDAAGGDVTAITELDESMHTTHRWPSMMPDGRSFVYLAAHRDATQRQNNALYLGSLDGGAPRRVIRSDFGGAFVSGRLLHVRDGILLASGMNTATGRIVGEPVVIARDLGGDLTTWHGQFSASPGGTLAYRHRPDVDGPRDRPSSLAGSAGDRIVSLGRDGRPLTSYAEGMDIATMAMSADGRQLIFAAVSADGSTDVWLHPTSWTFDFTEGVGDDYADAVAAIMTPDARRLTFLPGFERTPVWSPDAEAFAFSWDGGEDSTAAGLYRSRVRGGQAERILETPVDGAGPTDWSTDGRFLVYRTGPSRIDRANDLWYLDLADGTPHPLVTSAGADRGGRLSPDDRWLCFTSYRTGRSEVYVRAFAPSWTTDAPAGEWRISDEGGSRARWSREGDELFYLDDSGNLIAVGIDASGIDLVIESEDTLFAFRNDRGVSYDVTPVNSAGLTTFMFVDTRESPDAPIDVMLGWTRLLD